MRSDRTRALAAVAPAGGSPPEAPTASDPGHTQSLQKPGERKPPGARTQGRSQRDRPRKVTTRPFRRASHARGQRECSGGCHLAPAHQPADDPRRGRRRIVCPRQEVPPAGRVKRLEWRPDQKRLVGAVRGSRSEPYATSVWLAEDATGSEVTASSCSCPIGGHCKHVVASLLAYHEQVVASPLPAPRPADPGAGHPGASTAAQPVAAETAAPPGLEDRTGRVDPRRRRPAEQDPAGAQQLPAARPAVSRRRPEAGRRGGPRSGANTPIRS